MWRTRLAFWTLTMAALSGAAANLTGGIGLDESWLA
jgi:hypothetical protein